MYWNKRNVRLTKTSDETNEALPSDSAVRYAWAVRGMDPWTRRRPV